MIWRWLSKSTVLAIHNEQLAIHGGSSGIRDKGLLDSALVRPYNRFLYSSGVETEDLAASYAFGITRNHPFMDGNKRTAFVAASAFLLLNGKDLIASESDVVKTFQKLAEGTLSENELVLWFKKNTKSIDKNKS